MQRLVPVVFSLGLLAACVDRGEPPLGQPVVEVPEAAFDGTMAGWDGLALGPTSLRVPEYTWTRRHGWSPRLTGTRWTEGMATLVAEDGTEFPLLVEDVLLSGQVLTPQPMLAPGVYDLVVHLDGRLPVTVPGVTIGDHGQAPGFDDGTLLDGRVYSPYFQASTMLMASFVPIHLRVVPIADERAELTVWVQGFAADHEPLCRGWQGEVHISPTGLVTAERDEIVTGGVTTIAFTDVALRLGLGADGSDVAGVELDATIDTRPLDAFFADGATVGGETCALIEKNGGECFPCGDGADASCADLALRGGFGSATSAEDLLEQLDIDLESIDQVPICLGPDDRGDIPVLNCSVIGPVGVGAWFIGLGAVLLRRRRGSDGSG